MDEPSAQSAINPNLNPDPLVVPEPAAPPEKKEKLRAILILVIVVVIAGGAFWSYEHSRIKKFHPKWQEEEQGLVANKISQSADIIINLPNGVSLDASQANQAISFEPKILGNFTDGAKAKQLVFKPAKTLELGKYYRVTLASQQVRVQKDFLADEDPQISAIFPSDGSEAPETSEITLEFNRPMVPLTTLDELQKSGALPVKITPATAGKFKWITTRTLKFLPDKRLERSSHYKISVGQGLTSMDGLSLGGKEANFTTRPLSYASKSFGGITLYDQPVVVSFNQPVDLEKTKKLVELTQGGQAKNFVAEYGQRTVYFDDGATGQYSDKSVINIFLEKDRFGRDKIWDNNTVYSFTIRGAVPLEGDITLNEVLQNEVRVPDVLESVFADSPRSSLVEPGMFDPKGHLLLNFYEDIDKNQSRINGPNLQSIEYGQKCKIDEFGNEIRVGDNGECEKQDNKKQLVLKFSESAFRPDQSFDIELAKVVNIKGLQINGQSLHQNVKIYPSLKILSMHPGQNGGAASVTDLVICTNSPLKDAEVENFGQMLKSNLPVGKWAWDEAFKVYDSSVGFIECATGQYQNHIHYGLRPQTRYELELNLTDHFGQNINHKLQFTSGELPSIYYKFNSLQKDYNVTSPKLTKLTYSVENLQYVNLNICQVTGPVMLEYLNSDTQPSATTPGENLKCKITTSKKLDLPEKYWQANYFQVDLRDFVPDVLGYYVLSFSHPKLREQVYNYQTGQTSDGAQIYERSFLNVTNLAAEEKKVEVEAGQEAERSVERKVISASQGNLYWVSQISTLQPVAGAKVDVYTKSGKKYNFSSSAITDSTGIARSKAYAGDGAAIVSKDNDSTIVTSLTDKFQWASSSRGGERTYIYSDRPIYRPGQQVFVKALYRIGYDGVYEIFKDKPAHLQIYNSKNESVLEQDLKVADNGSFDTSYLLPKDAPLGTYRVEALGGYYSFDVEEYRPAAFKVDMQPEKQEYIAGETFNVNLDANYYFGVPVEGGEVEYSLMAQDYYFDRYQDSNFTFGSGWYYSYYPEYGDTYILRGKTTVGKDGKTKISETADFNKFFNDENRKQSKIFVLQATVKNIGGQAVSVQTSFIVHRGQFYLGVNLQKPYFAKNQANKLMIKSVDTQGKEMSVGGISGKINRVSWNYFKRQEVDGRYYYTSEKKLTTVKEVHADTDSAGNYSTDFTIGDEGEYEVEISDTDKLGNPIFARTDFYVYGSGVVAVQPLNNQSLDIAVENSQVEVGQKATIIIKSPASPAKALVAVERGRILDYKVIDINSSLQKLDLDVKDTYVPNFFVTVLLLSGKPEVRFGQAQFYTGTKEKTISVETKTNKNVYLPGEEVALDVLTKDLKGHPVSADVSLAVADLSVLALSGNPKKEPISFFYDGRPLGVTTASNLKNILTEAEIPAGTKGGGGAEPGDLAAKKRGVFKDTAYWNAHVKTDGSGYAQVKFTLPDNLTTWQTESVGLTTDTRLGAGYSEFSTKKQVMVVPLIPRFVIPGDEFVLGGKVFNQTDQSQTLQVSLESQTLQIVDNKPTSLLLSAGETKNVYFKVKAPANMESGGHKIILTAKNQNYTDSVENTFPIKRNETYEAVATTNYTKEASAYEMVWLPKNVVKDRGGLTLQTSATLAAAVPQALDYLVAYPYGCTEQMISKIESVATLKRLKAIKNLGDKFNLPQVEFDGNKYSADEVVSIGLSRIMANQTPEGGFSYYPNMRPDYYLTLDAVNALEKIYSAGYAIDEAAVQKAVQYLYQTFNSDNYLWRSSDTVILTAYTFSNVPSASQEFAAFVPKVNQIAKDAKFMNEDISNLSLTYLAILTVSGQLSSLQDKVFKVLENRVSVDGRGAYLGAGANNLWYYYETPVKDTALFIQALSLAKREYAETPRLLAWLKNSRAKDGAWGSTNNTITVFDALVDYLQFKPENLSSFALQLMQDDVDKGSYTFSGNTLADTWQSFLPMSDFSAEKLSQVKFVKKDLNSQANAYYYDMSLKYYLPVDNIAPRDEGFAVERELYTLDDKAGKNLLNQAKVGQVVRGHLKITVSKPRNFVAIENFIPAGTELVNFNLATENQNVTVPQGQPSYGYSSADGKTTLSKPSFWQNAFGGKSGTAIGDLPDEIYSAHITQNYNYYPDFSEYHDDRLMLFSQQLQPGVYEYDYYLRALIPGKFQHLPAVASELYTPENFGRTRGEWFEVKQ